jgi:hypothetical protein
MIHVGQQSAFPKLKFIANRAKLEHLIQQGRRQYRPRGLRDGDIQNVLSEDDLQGLLKRTKSNGPREEATYPLSGSESSSSAGFSRPGSPITLPLGFTFTRKNKKGLAELNTSAKSSTQTPDSPSLSKRLTGWWNTKSPRGTQPSTPKDPSRSRSPYTHHDRPNSMFELRPPKEVRELQAKSHARPEPRHSDFLEEMMGLSRRCRDARNSTMAARSATLMLVQTTLKTMVKPETLAMTRETKTKCRTLAMACLEGCAL